MKNKNTISAFTLIELLVVIVIIGILATIGIGTFSGYIKKAEEAKAVAASSLALKKILAATTEAETKLTAYYTFEGDDIADPIVDRSGSNNTVPLWREDDYSASDDSPGTGKSLRLENGTVFRRNDAVGVNNSPGPAEKITISVLFKVNEFVSGAINNAFFGSDRTLLLVNHDVPSPRLAFKNNSNPIQDYNNGAEIKEGRWYHALLSFDESTDVLKLYLNGELEHEASYTGSIYNDFKEIWMGSYSSTEFDGWIDEAIIAPVAIDLD